jgi:hypothetical protein
MIRPTSVVSLRGVPSGSGQLEGRGQVLDAPLDQRAAQVVGALLQVDALEVRAHAPHHDLARREEELRHAHDPGQAAELVGDAVGLGRVDVDVAVRDDDEVRVERQHLVLELVLEAARHRQHDDQRRDAQHDAHGGHRREDRERAKQDDDDDGQRRHEHAHDAGRLGGARVPARSEEHDEPEGDAAQRDRQRAERAARPARAVQVAEPHEALETKREQLAGAQREQDRERRSAERLPAVGPQHRPGGRGEGCGDENEAHEAAAHGRGNLARP